MEKNKIIDRLNIKDYNNNLEKILAKKKFPENAKNLLLSMLYKIENSYEDYKKVKVNVKLKKEILQEIIEVIKNNCEEIEIVKPNQGNIEKQYVKKIITYLDEGFLLYKIIELERNNFLINDKYKLIKKYLEKALREGYIININEIIRDFDGWAWNVSIKNINNLVYNFLYQTILIQVGQEFLENWKNSIEDKIDEMQKKLNKYETEEDIQKVIILISQISIIEYILFDNDERQNLIKKQDELQKKFNEISNKKEYLQKLATKKKEIGKEIRNIDNLLNDDYRLKVEFIQKNQLLSPEERIFSLSDFVELLQKKRVELIANLEVYANKMKPSNYVNEKHELENKLNLLKEIELEEDIKVKQKQLISELVKLTYKFFSCKIKQIQNKKEIVEMFYILRYYKFIPISEDTCIKDIEEIQQELLELEKEIIRQASNIRAINKFSKDNDENFNIVKNIMNTKIIDLENIYIELNRKQDKVNIIIYDENNIENTTEYNTTLKEVNIKYNKKIRLFN